MELTDDSPMPFGKHKGTLMADVPVEYLHWAWHEFLFKANGHPVRDYIVNNFNALVTENQDLIWEHEPNK